MSVVGLERALHQYTLEPSEVPFDMKTVPLATQPLAEQKGHLLTTSTHFTVALLSHCTVEALMMEDLLKPLLLHFFFYF